MSKPLGILFLLLFLLSLTPTLPLAAPTIKPTATRIIDGDPTDWTGTAPATDNTWTYSNGEWIWKDAVGDQRNNFATITIDGHSWDWYNNYGKYIVAVDTDPADTNFAGANVTKLYMAWDDDYLYIALEMHQSATSSWNVDYGIAIDTGSGGYTTGTDAYSKNIQFGGGFAPDFEIYIKARGTGIDGVTLHNYTGGSWQWIKDIQSSDYAYADDSYNIVFVELRVAWADMGISIPKNISVIAWAAGTSAGDSAVDTVPSDPSVIDDGSEWSDTDTLTNLTTVDLTIVNKIIDTWVDLVEWRISGDTNNLYMMFKLRNTSGVKLGMNNSAPYIAVAFDIDRVSGSDLSWFPEYADTHPSSDARWEYALIINLADSRLSGRTYINSSALDDNYGSVMHLYDNSYTNFGGVGQGAIGIDLDKNVVEVAVPWTALGFASAPNNVYIRFTVMAARGYSNYAKNNGGPVDISGSSDAVDVVTTATDTWSEVSDGYIDYYGDIWFVDGEPTVPPTTLNLVAPSPANGASLYVGETYTFKALLEVAGSPAAEQAIWVYINGVNKTGLGGKTNSSGEYAFDLSIDSTMVSSLNVTVYHPGNTSIGSTEASDTRLYAVFYKSRFTSVSVNVSTTYLGEAFNVSGILEYYDGTTWLAAPAGEEIEITIASTTVTVKTNSTGGFEAMLTAPTYIGSWIITITHHDNTTSGIAGNTTTATIDTVGIRDIDGSSTDWVGLLPPRGNMWNVTNNELVWRDAIGDTRTDADWKYPDASTVSDIEEFHVTIDQYYIYFMLKLKDIHKIGVAGAPIIDIAIDRDQSGGSGTGWLPGNSDTKAYYYAYWEAAVRVDLSTLSTYAYHGSSSPDWSDPLYVLYGGWNLQDSTHAWLSVNNITEVVEIAVPWDIIGGAPSTGDELRFTVIIGVGDHSGNFFDIWSIQGEDLSNTLDAITGYEPNTWNDVEDKVVDYYLTVYTASNYLLMPGDTVSMFWISPTPHNGSTVPANVPITFKVYGRDNLYNKLSHFNYTVFNVTSGTKIMDVEADGLGYAEFTLTLSPGEHHIKVVFNGTGLIPSGETYELVLFAEPIYPTRLNMTWSLLTDADGNGYVTPGDTVRITMTLEYYNSTEGMWKPFPNADIRLNSTEAGVDTTVTTDNNGVATYDWVVMDIGGPKWVRFDANYSGNDTAVGTPRFYGSANHTYIPYYIARIVDGDLSDWIGTPPATTPGITTSGMEIIITDPSGDMRTDRLSQYDWPKPADLDIVEARLLIDKYELYGAVKYADNSSPYKILFIVIDVEPFNDTGKFWLPGYSDTMLGTIDGGKLKPLSWDYVIWINPGDNVVDAYNLSGHFANVGRVATTDNAGTIEFYARLSDFGLNGTELAGKQIRIWVIQFASDWGNIFDPTDKGISKVASDVYDVAGVSGTVGVEIWDDDGAADNDVWPAQDHWIETGFGIAIGTDYMPSLSPSATPTSASVVLSPSSLAIGEIGNVTVIVSPATTGSVVELRDHDTGDTIWTGITSFDGVAKLGVTYNAKGLHTVDVYVDGTYMTSFTVNVSGYMSKLLIDNIELTDNDGDGLPDQISVEGYLYWYNGTDWLPATGNTTNIELVFAYYDLKESVVTNTTIVKIETTYTVNLGTAIVGADASFSLTTALSLPAGYPEGGYIVRITYSGDAQRLPATNTSLDAKNVRSFIPLYGTLPTDPFTLTGTTPGLYIGDGQLLYVDPTGDYATEHLSGTVIVDLEKLWIGVSNGYLVVKADYAGDLTLVLGNRGNSAPFLVIMLDTTPSDTADGVDSFLWLIPGYGFKFTPDYTWPYPPYSNRVAGKLVAGLGTGETKYTHAIIISPVEPGNPATNYVVWLVYVEGGTIVGKPLGIIRMSDLANGVFIAYIPLTDLGISSVQDIRLWAVSGAIYTGGTIYAREIIDPSHQDPATNGKYWHTMVYDVPGTSFIPDTSNENIYAAVYNWSLLLTIDPTNGFTKLYARLVPVELPDGLVDGKLYVGPAGNHTFTYKLYGSEADLPIIGATIVLAYNTTTYTDTSAADGKVTYSLPVPSSDVSKNATITLTIQAPSPVELVETPTYNVRILYYVKIINATMTWIDVDNYGFISKGDTLKFYVETRVFDETGNWVPMAGIKVSFWIHSTPYLLGTNTTDNNGVATFTYTVTGDENIVGTHDIVIQAGDDTTYATTQVTPPGAQALNIFMQPLPETPILPILLLAALLLFIIIKKRK